MKDVWYYYIRDDKNRPLITVCLLKGYSHIYNHSGECFSRGIAFCSNKDNPVKKIGRNIARGMAEQAMFHKISCNKIHSRGLSDLLHLMEKSGLKTSWKATFDPTLSEFECRLLSDNKLK